MKTFCLDCKNAYAHKCTKFEYVNSKPPSSAVVDVEGNIVACGEFVRDKSLNQKKKDKFKQFSWDCTRISLCGYFYVFTSGKGWKQILLKEYTPVPAKKCQCKPITIQQVNHKNILVAGRKQKNDN